MIDDLSVVKHVFSNLLAMYRATIVMYRSALSLDAVSASHQLFGAADFSMDFILLLDKILGRDRGQAVSFE